MEQSKNTQSLKNQKKNSNKFCHFFKTKNSNLFGKTCFSNVNFLICKIATIQHHKIENIYIYVLMVEWI
jgi:hypothetical protein